LCTKDNYDGLGRYGGYDGDLEILMININLSTFITCKKYNKY